jgi:hypothetical protein
MTSAISSITKVRHAGPDRHPLKNAGARALTVGQWTPDQVGVTIDDEDKLAGVMRMRAAHVTLRVQSTMGRAMTMCN